MANYEIWKIRNGTGGTDAAVGWMAMMPTLPMAGVKHSEEGQGDIGSSWYIEGNGIKMLFDCGQASGNVTNLQFTGGRASPRSGLADWGNGGADELRWTLEEEFKVGIDEINYVVPSHLHSPHSCCVALLPQDQLIVNRQDIVGIWDPEPPHRFGVSREHLLKILCREEPEQLLIIDGDYNLAPGLDIIFTGGHSWGHNCLLVQTKKGKVGMLGALGGYLNLYPGDPEIYERSTGKPMPFGFAKGTILPQGLVDDPQTQVKGLERIRALADILVPFEQSAPKMIPEQWWDKPSVEYQNYVREAYRKYKPGVYPDVLHLLERRQKAKTARKRRQQ